MRVWSGNERREEEGKQRKVNTGNEMWTKNRKQLCKIMKKKAKTQENREKNIACRGKNKDRDSGEKTEKPADSEQEQSRGSSTMTLSH